MTSLDQGVMDSEDLYEEMTNVEIKTRPAWVRVLAVVGAALFYPGGRPQLYPGLSDECPGGTCRRIGIFLSDPLRMESRLPFSAMGAPPEAIFGKPALLL